MKTVLVTGANSGIGQQIALNLDEAGFRVMLLARNQQRLTETANRLKNSPQTLSCDLSKQEDLLKVEPFLQPIKKDLCGVINNAGIYIANDFLNTSDKNWQDMFNVNLLAPALIAKKISPLLIESDQSHKFIINISSTACARPIPGTAAYASLKAGLNHLTKVLALELAPYKICVNSVSPGIIDTPLHSFDKNDIENMKNMNQLQPLGKVGHPKDIASIVQFLASANNNWITGSDFTVDGGIALT